MAVNIPRSNISDEMAMKIRADLHFEPKKYVPFDPFSNPEPEVQSIDYFQNINGVVSPGSP